MKAILRIGGIPIALSAIARAVKPNEIEHLVLSYFGQSSAMNQDLPRFLARNRNAREITDGIKLDYGTAQGSRPNRGILLASINQNRGVATSAPTFAAPAAPSGDAPPGGWSPTAASIWRR